MKYKQVRIKILEYDRIDLSEGIYANMCEDTSKKCSLCQYYYFVFKNLIIKDIYAMGVMICL